MSPPTMFNMYHTGPLQGCSGDLVGFIDSRRVVNCRIGDFSFDLEDVLCDRNLGRCRIFGHRLVILVVLVVIILWKSVERQGSAVGIFPISLIQCQYLYARTKRPSVFILFGS